jgi:DNA-binding MarR family transcriptional regulator
VADEFDPVIHAPARLKLLMILARLPVASFNDLAHDAGLTAGNLAAHLKALEAAGYVQSARGLIDLKPRVRYAMTPAGRDALKRYCAALREAVLRIEDAVG